MSGSEQKTAAMPDLPFQLPVGSRPDEMGAAEPVFAETWQAQAFALVVALQQRGLFTWTEWAAELSKQVASPDAKADGSDYYQHWLAALETLLGQKGVAGSHAVDALSEAWQRAAHATPHGMPILLENDPERA